MSKDIQLSRTISYLLRHNPRDLSMDKEGWVKTIDLLNYLDITIDLLQEIVDNNDKKRFAFNVDKSKIRASQGHSKKLKLNIKFKEVQFPTNYYHGTIFENVKGIMKYGLKSQNREYVHLSKDVKTAITVGRRHGKAIVILIIDGNQMKRDGLKIYESENGVILVNYVDPKYIKIKNDLS